MASRSMSKPPSRMSRVRFIGCVFLPYASGYFLSYVFRSVNAVIAADLTVEFHLSAADLGLLTAVFFLTFAVAQLPIATLLDRLETNIVQSVLMLFSAAGALIFAEAHSFVALVVGRGLIGLGAAATLTAALKAIIPWTPTERIPLATGVMITFGALGALAATGPAHVIAQQIGWRALFAILAALTALSALAVLFTVQEATVRALPQQTVSSLSAVLRDQRFWRVIPLCAIGIGSSWSLQSLWAASWMRDVQGFDQTHVVDQLSLMAIAACCSAPILGVLSVRFQRSGIGAEYLIVGMLSLSGLAQLALLLHLPLPPLLLWTIISAAGAATVLGYTLINGYFHRSVSARANGVLNLLNVGSAILLQAATGFILARWPNNNGAYPFSAYQTALAIPLVLQLIALLWFSVPRQPSFLMKQRAATWTHHRPNRNRRSYTPIGGWPFAALASTTLWIMLASTVVSIRGASSFHDRARASYAESAADRKMSTVALPMAGNSAATTIAGKGW